MTAMDNLDRRILRYVDRNWRVDSYSMAKDLGLRPEELNPRLEKLQEKDKVFLRHYCGGTDVTIVTDKEKLKRRKTR